MSAHVQFVKDVSSCLSFSSLIGNMVINFTSKIANLFNWWSARSEFASFYRVKNNFKFNILTQSEQDISHPMLLKARGLHGTP